MRPSSNSNLDRSMIIEGFICPECQQDLTSIELLQAHFELFHSKKTTTTGKKQQSSSGFDSFGSDLSTRSGFSSVLAKAKTLITSLDEPPDPPASSSSYHQSLSNDQTNSPMSQSPGNQQFQQQQQANNSINSNVSNHFLKEYFNTDQREGKWTNHTSDFKKFRDNTIGRYVVQTNKLLITLDKLISIDDEMFYDDAKREAHYKSIVSWIADADVKLCPNCAKSFNILNRKHHCRLCGAIMCNRCCKFLSFALAKQLTDPDALIKANSSSNGVANGGGSSEFKLKRADSVTSVNSYFFKSTNSDQSLSSNSSSSNTSKKTPTSRDFEQLFIRLCLNCCTLLEKKYEMLKEKHIKSQFTDLYNELFSCISETQRLVPVFNKMVDSLNLGETTYQLSNAEDIRHKLVNLFKRAESMSASILNFGVTTSDQKTSSPSQPSHDQIKLQRNIRYFIINYLRENSFNLAQLPNGDEYAVLVKQRERFLIEEARRNEVELARQRRQINERIAATNGGNNRSGGVSGGTSSSSSTTKYSKNTVRIDNSNGWIASQGARKDELELDENGDANAPPDADALRIQIQLVEGYIEDALKANRTEEADLLRANLNELLTCLANLN